MAAPTDAQLDVITIGRASVDLYGQQIGTRLEDVGTFIKAVGGCPTNIAVGTARLGLRSALITRVGDEQMGRFIREQLEREGVTTTGIRTDPDRLTALVLLSVEDEGVSPMIFYRTDCADMALSEEDIEESFVASAGAVVVTGTHFSRPHSEAALLKAVRIARAHGRRVVFDIDYRPNLWGLAGHAAGFERYVKSDFVTSRIRPVLPDCDLIVGTEEEVLIAGGQGELHAALTAIRAVTDATIVLKRGAKGCIVYEGPIPNDLEQGIVGQGFPIEIYNVLGAGDAFMSGFLRGWLKGESHATSATWANACGAFAVSRLLCAPEYPTWQELSYFLAHGSPHRALRKDETINHLHWATTRRGTWPRLMALAIDHRKPIEDIAGGATDRIAPFKALAVEAAARVAAGRHGFGMLIDDRYGREALFAAGRQQDLWIGRPLELPGSRPLRFEFSQDVGSRLVEWPVNHVAKVLCFLSPGRSARAQGGAGRLDACRLPGDPQHRPRAPRRDHCQQGRRGGRAHLRAGIDGALRHRAQARLVEARAAGQRRSVGRDRPRDRNARPSLPGRGAARARSADGGAGHGLRPCQRLAEGLRLRRRAHDFRRCSQGVVCRSHFRRGRRKRHGLALRRPLRGLGKGMK
jgi:5-dehydro-2-deoxygluconokinase